LTAGETQLTRLVKVGAFAIYGGRLYICLLEHAREARQGKVKIEEVEKVW
jgi:hypothetical protein